MGDFLSLLWIFILLQMFPPRHPEAHLGGEAAVRHAAHRGRAAVALGLPVSDVMPREIYVLMDLYPQAGPRWPSVEFIPAPYRPPGPHRPGGRP